MDDNFFKCTNPDEISENNEEQKILGDVGFGDLNLCLRRPVWFPGELVFELNVSRRELKKSEGLKKLHKWIQKAGDCGILTRQELVSMLPPIALEPKIRTSSIS